MTKEKRKAYNRAILIIVGAIFLTAWVMMNSRTWSTSAITYIVIGALGIILYLNWDKIKT